MKIDKSNTRRKKSSSVKSKDKSTPKNNSKSDKLKKELTDEKDKYVRLFAEFEIKNKFLDMIMTKSFQYGLNKIADAFQKRAEKI